MVNASPTQSPLGLQFVKEDVVLVADAGISKGQVCKLTLDSTNLVFDAATPAVAADAELTAAGKFNFYGVALEDIDSGKKGSFRLKGKVEALGGDTSAALTALTCDASGRLHAAPVDPGADTDSSFRTFAVNLEALTDGGLKNVIFDGLGGFGFVEAAS
jgi:hypothetical protein